jgi:hypothetical protein
MGSRTTAPYRVAIGQLIPQSVIVHWLDRATSNRFVGHAKHNFTQVVDVVS